MTDPKAGRELDAEIAERVMGWSSAFGKQEIGFQIALIPMGESAILDLGREWYGRPDVDDDDLVRVPDYSTSIADAWLVVEKMRKVGWDFALRHFGTYTAEFVPRDPRRDTASSDEDSAPLAICRASLAALRAVEHAQSGVTNAGRQ